MANDDFAGAQKRSGNELTIEPLLLEMVPINGMLGTVHSHDGRQLLVRAAIQTNMMFSFLFENWQQGSIPVNLSYFLKVRVPCCSLHQTLACTFIKCMAHAFAGAVVSHEDSQASWSMGRCNA